MSELEILDVVRGELNPQLFWGGGIDTPAAGAHQNYYALPVSGWVLHRDTEKLTIEAITEGRSIGTWQVNQERPDVAITISAPVTPFCGFAGIIEASTLPRQFEVRIDVVEANSRSSLGTIHGRRSAFGISSNDAIRPALVTTLGRTGSTLLMLLLSQHPELIVHPPFPFETRLARYWASTVTELASPNSYLQALVTEDDRRYWWLGHKEFPVVRLINQDPAAQWLGGLAIENLANFARQQVIGFYEASTAFQSKAVAPRYFVEKQLPNPELREVQRELFPGHAEIFLVRDFRDMLVSILAFNEKRSHKGFGTDLRTGVEYVAWLGRAVEALLYNWRTAAAGAQLVRYEDLVRQPRPVLQQLLQHLKLEESDALVDEMIRNAETVEPGAQEQHRTSLDSQASIGRWREELPEEIRESSQRVFAEALTVFGYELS
jgi:Sulfotransferase family